MSWMFSSRRSRFDTFTFCIVLDQPTEESALFILLVITYRPNRSQTKIAILSKYKLGSSRGSTQCFQHDHYNRFRSLNSSWWRSRRTGDSQVGAGIFNRLLTAFGSFSKFRDRHPTSHLGAPIEIR